MFLGISGERLNGSQKVMASCPLISAKHNSDEHLLLFHRRLRRESGHLTQQTPFTGIDRGSFILDNEKGIVSYINLIGDV